MEMNSVENHNLLSPEISGRIFDHPPGTDRRHHTSCHQSGTRNWDPLDNVLELCEQTFSQRLELKIADLNRNANVPVYSQEEVRHKILHAAQMLRLKQALRLRIKADEPCKMFLPHTFNPKENAT